MLPHNVLSTTAVSAGFLPPRNAVPVPLIDYDEGGIALSDASAGLQVKAWRCRWIAGQFIVDAIGTPPTVIYSRDNVTEFSFTFDQNMQPFLTFVDNTGPYYYWFDTTVPGFVLVSLASDVITPKCALDDKRLPELGSSDIILAYIREGNLYYRQQRDRFGVERLLASDIGGTLRRVGMNLVYRFQFEIGH